jgi:3-oxoacyl-[acyl-carrier-protein] synthase I
LNAVAHQSGERVVIVAMGANTPVGRDAWSSAAAVRAGISGFGEHPYMADIVGEPMRVAMAPWLDANLSGTDRLEALLLPAITQALQPLSTLPPDQSALKIAIALGLPSPRPGVAGDVAADMLERVLRQHGQHFSASATFTAGHAAGLLALDAAVTKLTKSTASHAASGSTSNRLDACVVAGVDSYIHPKTLDWLERCDQIHSAGPLNNAWGFIPGEASGALLLMRESLAAQLNLPTLAVVLGCGVAHEPKHIKTETVCLGEGLTQAFRTSLAALPTGLQVSDIYCDMNGEPYRGDEFGFTALRTKEHFASISEFVTPADCWGDVAAAGGPLHIILALIAGIKGYAQGELAFVWSSAELGERAAVLVATTKAVKKD